MKCSATHAKSLQTHKANTLQVRFAFNLRVYTSTQALNPSTNCAQWYTLSTRSEIADIKISLYRFGSLIWIRSAVCLLQSICAGVPRKLQCVSSCTQAQHAWCRFTDSAQVCALALALETQTWRNTCTVCLAWQTATTHLTSLYLPSHVPRVPSPLSPSFLFFPSFNTSLPCSYTSSAATNHCSGESEWTEGGTENVKGGDLFCSFSFLSNKRPVGIHLGPICWHRATEWAASWLNQHGWKIVARAGTSANRSGNSYDNSCFNRNNKYKQLRHLQKKARTTIDCVEHQGWQSHNKSIQEEDHTRCDN